MNSFLAAVAVAATFGGAALQLTAVNAADADASGPHPPPLPLIQSSVPIEYPSAAAKLGREGRVLLAFGISEQGRATSASILFLRPGGDRAVVGSQVHDSRRLAAIGKSLQAVPTGRGVLHPAERAERRVRRRDVADLHHDEPRSGFAGAKSTAGGSAEQSGAGRLRPNRGRLRHSRQTLKRATRSRSAGRGPSIPPPPRVLVCSRA